MTWEDFDLGISLGGAQYEISALVLLVFVASFVAFLLLLRRIARGRASAGACRWKRTRDYDRPPFRSWRCAACAADGFATGRGPPAECKRMLRGGM